MAAGLCAACLPRTDGDGGTRPENSKLRPTQKAHTLWLSSFVCSCFLGYYDSVHAHVSENAGQSGETTIDGTTKDLDGSESEGGSSSGEESSSEEEEDESAIQQNVAKARQAEREIRSTGSPQQDAVELAEASVSLAGRNERNLTALAKYNWSKDAETFAGKEILTGGARMRSNWAVILAEINKIDPKLVFECDKNFVVGPAARSARLLFELYTQLRAVGSTDFADMLPWNTEFLSPGQYWLDIYDADSVTAVVVAVNKYTVAKCRVISEPAELVGLYTAIDASKWHEYVDDTIELKHVMPHAFTNLSGSIVNCIGEADGERGGFAPNKDCPVCNGVSAAVCEDLPGDDILGENDRWPAANAKMKGYTWFKKKLKNTHAIVESYMMRMMVALTEAVVERDQLVAAAETASELDAVAANAAATAAETAVESAAVTGQRLEVELRREYGAHWTSWRIGTPPKASGVGGTGGRHMTEVLDDWLFELLKERGKKPKRKDDTASLCAAVLACGGCAAASRVFVHGELMQSRWVDEHGHLSKEVDDQGYSLTVDADKEPIWWFARCIGPGPEGVPNTYAIRYADGIVQQRVPADKLRQPEYKHGDAVDACWCAVDDGTVDMQWQSSPEGHACEQTYGKDPDGYIWMPAVVEQRTAAQMQTAEAYVDMQGFPTRSTYRVRFLTGGDSRHNTCPFVRPDFIRPQAADGAASAGGEPSEPAKRAASPAPEATKRRRSSATAPPPAAVPSGGGGGGGGGGASMVPPALAVPAAAPSSAPAVPAAAAAPRDSALKRASSADGSAEPTRRSGRNKKKKKKK